MERRRLRRQHVGDLDAVVGGDGGTSGDYVGGSGSGSDMGSSDQTGMSGGGSDMGRDQSGMSRDSNDQDTDSNR